MFGLEKGQD